MLVMETSDEKWLPLRDFPEDYEVSSIGRVRRTSHKRGATVGRVRKEQSFGKYRGYLFSRNSMVVARMTHRLVADAFLGPIPHGMQVNHKNGEKHDNRVENLEIVTASENRAHSYRVLGIAPNRPSVFGNATLDWNSVDAIRKEYAGGGTSYSKLGEKYSVSKRTIMEVVLKRRWRDEDRPST